MKTLLVRLKPHAPRRGHVLRRYTYRGIKFQEERGWYRVEEPIAVYLRGVQQIHGDEHSPLAFDVCTEAEAKAIDTEQEAEIRTAAAGDIKLSSARSAAVTTEDLPKAKTPRKPRQQG